MLASRFGQVTRIPFQVGGWDVVNRWKTMSITAITCEAGSRWLGREGDVDEEEEERAKTAQYALWAVSTSRGGRGSSLPIPISSARIHALQLRGRCLQSM